MDSESGWGISVLSGLQAHFWQDDGSSRPGTDWVVLFSNDEVEKRILVRTYSDTAPFVGMNQDEQVRAVLSYVSELVESGWSPENYVHRPGALTVPPAEGAQRTVVTPVTGESNSKPWWRFW